MTNFYVGQKCLIIGARFKETEHNIGKVVTLLEFIPNGSSTYSAGKLAGPVYTNCWYVEGDNLISSFINPITGGQVFKGNNRIFVAQHLLMPLDGIEEIEQSSKYQELFH